MIEKDSGSELSQRPDLYVVNAVEEMSQAEAGDENVIPSEDVQGIPSGSLLSREMLEESGRTRRNLPLIRF